MKQTTSKIILFAFLFLMLMSFSPATAFTPSDDDSTTETEDETETTTTEIDDNDSTYTDDEDDDHELDEYRDSNGTVWITTDVITVTLNPDLPVFQYWYEGDDNGSLVRFMVSFMMIVEFEDSNGDGVYQPNETLAFAPLDAFEWSLQSGKILDESNQVTELFASYTKGGMSDEWEDDWFEDWMPEEEEDDEDNETFSASSDDSTEYNFSTFSGMTLRFYGHLYASDFTGNVSDDSGVLANYTITGGMELKVDIEIGNFPFVSNTSKVAVLNYLREDVASSDDYEHYFRLHEDHGDVEFDSEDVSDDYGIEFEDHDEDQDGDDDDVQQLSLVDSVSNTTRGLYSWLDKAIITHLNGSQTAVDVEASYWTDGKGLLLFLAYPNFNGGSLLHDPSLKLLDVAAPVIPQGFSTLPFETIALIGVGAAIILVAGIVVKRR